MPNGVALYMITATGSVVHHTEERQWSTYCKSNDSAHTVQTVQVLVSALLLTERGGGLSVMDNGRKDLLWCSVVVLSALSPRLNVLQGVRLIVENTEKFSQRSPLQHFNKGSLSRAAEKGPRGPWDFSVASLTLCV